MTKSISLSCVKIFAKRCLSPLQRVHWEYLDIQGPFSYQLYFCSLKFPLDINSFSFSQSILGFLTIFFNVEQTTFSKWRAGSKFLLGYWSGLCVCSIALDCHWNFPPGQGYCLHVHWGHFVGKMKSSHCLHNICWSLVLVCHWNYQVFVVCIDFPCYATACFQFQVLQSWGSQLGTQHQITFHSL